MFKRLTFVVAALCPVLLFADAQEVTIPGYSPAGEAAASAKPAPAGGTAPKPVTPATSATEVQVPEVTPVSKLSEPAEPKAEEKKVLPATGPGSMGSITINNAGIIGMNAVLQWRSYLRSLPTCTAGTFILPQINPELKTTYSRAETDTIIGMDKKTNKCIVKIIYYLDGDPALSPPRSGQSAVVVGRFCKFTPGGLASVVKQFTDTMNANIVSGTTTIPIANAMSQECQDLTTDNLNPT